jgi:hypothetical protein
MSERAALAAEAAKESLSKSIEGAGPWLDISDEERRTYTFPGGHQVTVFKPVQLACKNPPAGVAGGGSHRIADEEGNGHYIPHGWIKISWAVKPGRPAVRF